MRSILFIQLITFSLVSSEFVSPATRFEGLTRISEHENTLVNKKCGVQSGLNKMNHGTIARKGQFPWAVAIETKKSYRLCSGTIISQRHVLTAAHCVVNIDYLNSKVCMNKAIESESEEIEKGIIGGYVAYGGNCNFNGSPGYKFNTTGSPCEKDDMTRVLISAVAWEKRYRDKVADERCTNFDIAIIEVARDFRWNNFVRPACLTLPDFDYNGLIGSFYGFGLVDTAEETDSNPKLQYFPDLRYGAGKVFRWDNSLRLDVKPMELTEKQRVLTETSPMVQVESGDSGGGIVTTCGSRTILVGVATEATEKFYKSRGMQVHPHINEICQLTGVCPIDQCNDE